MLEKIISDGQSGASQAGLDSAIRNGILFGGWIPKVQMHEDGLLLYTYNLIELPTKSDSESTKKNIIESDGTLILFHNRLTVRHVDTRKWALEYGKPVFDIDSNIEDYHNSAAKICIWLSDRNIHVLNIAGSRLSEDAKSYDTTIKILDSVYYLSRIEHDMEKSLKEKCPLDDAVPSNDMPNTIDESVESIIGDMDLKNKVALSRLTENGIEPLQLSLGLYIKERLKIWSENDQFTKACIQTCREEGLDESNPSIVIIKRIWKRLKKTHTLKIVQ